MKKRQALDLGFERENLTNMLFSFIQTICRINQVFFFLIQSRPSYSYISDELARNLTFYLKTKGYEGIRS